LAPDPAASLVSSTVWKPRWTPGAEVTLISLAQGDLQLLRGERIPLGPAIFYQRLKVIDNVRCPGMETPAMAVPVHRQGGSGFPVETKTIDEGSNISGLRGDVSLLTGAGCL